MDALGWDIFISNVTTSVREKKITKTMRVQRNSRSVTHLITVSTVMPHICAHEQQMHQDPDKRCVFIQNFCDLQGCFLSVCGQGSHMKESRCKVCKKTIS